jgi:hydroxyacylglutathione hydrolase
MEIYNLVFSPIEVNTYILADESGKCAIIDCGCFEKSENEELTRFIKMKNLDPVLLLDTHCHLDHIFGNRYLLEKYNLRAFSGEFDEMNRKNAVNQARSFGLSIEAPPEPEGFISDNQVFRFGTSELKSIHVPGHAPGGFAFYSEKDECVFTGDALFAGSIGRTDLAGGDYDTLISSIRNRLFVLPQNTVVYPGHGGDTTIGREIDSNPFFT